MSRWKSGWRTQCRSWGKRVVVERPWAPWYAVRGCECREWVAPVPFADRKFKGPRNFEWTATGRQRRRQRCHFQAKGGGHQTDGGAGTFLGISSQWQSQTAGTEMFWGTVLEQFCGRAGGQRSQKISGDPRCPDDQFGAHWIDWAIGVAAEFPPIHFPLRANSESRLRPSTASPTLPTPLLCLDLLFTSA